MGALTTWVIAGAALFFFLLFGLPLATERWCQLTDKGCQAAERMNAPSSSVYRGSGSRIPLAGPRDPECAPCPSTHPRHSPRPGHPCACSK